MVLCCEQVTLILKLVEALLKDEGGKTPLHEIARRRCMQAWPYLWQGHQSQLAMPTAANYV